MKSVKKTDKMDTLLKSCLHTEQEPGDILHHRVMQKWKEQSDMKRRKFYKTAVAAASVVLLSALSVSAAAHFLTPKEAAAELGGTEMEALFETDDANFINETKEGEKYNFTLLGMTEGKNLNQLDDDGNILEKDSFYAVVAISNKDGSPLSTEDFYGSGDGYFISPLIQGLAPWQYNIASMNGGYSEAERNGVVYRMVNCDKIGYFADRNLYLCISDTSFYETEAYDYDEASGTITPNDDYKGTNLLFHLPIESSRADAAKAKEYLEKLEEEWSAGTDETDETDTGIDHPDAQADYAAYLEAEENTPEKLDTVLTDLGMTVTGRQTVSEEDGAFCFEQKTEDGDSNQYAFFSDSFKNGMTHSMQYSRSETEAHLGIIVVRLNEDKTATCTFYEKTYPYK